MLVRRGSRLIRPVCLCVSKEHIVGGRGSFDMRSKKVRRERHYVPLLNTSPAPNDQLNTLHHSANRAISHQDAACSSHVQVYQLQSSADQAKYIAHGAARLQVESLGSRGGREWLCLWWNHTVRSRVCGHRGA
jgi:hypothetical protein